MKRLITIVFFLSVVVLLPGGCTYYYPLGYDSSYYNDNYGFIAPFTHYSPFGDYSYPPYPYSYPYGYYYPSTRFYLGEGRERHFEQGERPGGEK